MSRTISRCLISATSLMALIGSISLAIYWSRLGLFNNTTALQAYLGHSVLIGPLIFITIQIIQVVIPVIPGGISTAAGVLVFGPLWGFVYNYVGIAIGSILNFLLARQFGKPFILHVISEKKRMTSISGQLRKRKTLRASSHLRFSYRSHQTMSCA